MGNLLIENGLIVTRCTGCSDGASLLPITNVPPGRDTIWGSAGAAGGALTMAGGALPTVGDAWPAAGAGSGAEAARLVGAGAGGAGTEGAAGVGTRVAEGVACSVF